jgi:hypothetical protein
LLLKTQQFIEMLKEIAKVEVKIFASTDACNSCHLQELPPLPQEQQQELLTPQPHFTHSPSPRPSSSRGGKRSASAVEEEDAMAGTSAEGGSGNQHNPVKRRSSDGLC